MRKQFNLQDWLKDKSQKVETRDGRRVERIWKLINPPPINNREAEICALIEGEDDALVFLKGCKYPITKDDTESPYDLFLITPEPELTEFEKRLSDVVGYAISLSVAKPQKPTSEFVKEYAAELLALARKQLIEEQYTSDPRKTDLYKLGKAEALKDLPRWKKDKSFETEGTFMAFMGVNGRECFVVNDGYSISVAELIEKLPGFKEN